MKINRYLTNIDEIIQGQHYLSKNKLEEAKNYLMSMICMGISV